MSGSQLILKMKELIDEYVDELTIDAVWEKAKKIPEQNAKVWRKDAYGNTIKKSSFGKIRSKYGWQIILIIPFHKGGAFFLSNLEPVHLKRVLSKL
jgi:hypothetical protein